VRASLAPPRLPAAPVSALARGQALGLGAAVALSGTTAAEAAKAITPAQMHPLAAVRVLPGQVRQWSRRAPLRAPSIWLPAPAQRCPMRLCCGFAPAPPGPTQAAAAVAVAAGRARLRCQAQHTTAPQRQPPAPAQSLRRQRAVPPLRLQPLCRWVRVGRRAPVTLASEAPAQAALPPALQANTGAWEQAGEAAAKLLLYHMGYRAVGLPVTPLQAAEAPSAALRQTSAAAWMPLRPPLLSLLALALQSAALLGPRPPPLLGRLYLLERSALAAPAAVLTVLAAHCRTAQVPEMPSPLQTPIPPPRPQRLRQSLQRLLLLLLLTRLRPPLPSLRLKEATPLCRALRAPRSAARPVCGATPTKAVPGWAGGLGPPPRAAPLRGAGASRAQGRTLRVQLQQRHRPVPLPPALVA
jgi:hypothetical protein